MNAAFSPRVVGQHRPDYHCLESILASPQFAGKEGEAMALAIYDFFTSTVDGTYHFWPSNERTGEPRTWRINIDAVKLLNCYGWAICGQTAHTLLSLYRAGGLEARLFGVPGHSLCEVFYDGRWHILDVDMWTWFRTPEGHIASAYELATNAHALIIENTEKSNPCNLPDRSLDGYATMYDKTETVDGHVECLVPPWEVRAHTMDFHLRPGETLIRSQTHEGRYHLPLTWLESAKQYGKEWHGSPRERFQPFRTFGNGRWIYEPDLTNSSTDLAEGHWQRDGLDQTEAGLAGPGDVTFRIQSPYIFCGRPQWSDVNVTSSDGVWLSAAGQGPVTIEITDLRQRWVTVLDATSTFDQCNDITPLMDGRYDAMIRMTLGEGASLARFRFEGFIQTAPLSIPRLVAGGNELELRAGDKHTLTTVPWSELIDFRAAADVLAQLAGSDNVAVGPRNDDWQQAAPADPKRPVQLVARFDAPGDCRWAWAYALASVREAPVGQTGNTVQLEWSQDGETWQVLTDQAISATRQQWDHSIDGELVCDTPVGSLWFRVTSQTAVTALEFHGHISVRAAADQPLRITHAWQDDHGDQVVDAPPGSTRYVVDCGPNPKNHTITMHMPSTRSGV